MDDRWEWVEIVEPRTRDRMYANLVTGDCVWQPPPGVSVKKMHDDQWWELFDQKTGRYYYYNATSQKTVWHRPHNSDIIPLAKLQHAKQAAELSDTARPARQTASSSGAASASCTPTLERKLAEEHIYSNRMAAIAGRNMYTSHMPAAVAASPIPQRQRVPCQYQTSAAYDKVDQLMNNGSATGAAATPRRSSLSSVSSHSIGGSLTKPDLSAMSVGYEPLPPHVTVGAVAPPLPDNPSAFSRDGVMRASGHSKHPTAAAAVPPPSSYHYPQLLQHQYRQQPVAAAVSDHGRDYVNRAEIEHHRRGSLDGSVPLAAAPHLAHRGSLRLAPSSGAAAVQQPRGHHRHPLVQSASLSFVEQQPQQQQPQQHLGLAAPHDPYSAHGGGAATSSSFGSPHVGGGTATSASSAVRARPRLGVRAAAQPRTNPKCKPSVTRPNVLQLSGTCDDEQSASSPGSVQSPLSVVGSGAAALGLEHASWGSKPTSCESGIAGHASGSALGGRDAPLLLCAGGDSPPSLQTSGFGSHGSDVAELRCSSGYYEAGVGTSNFSLLSAVMDADSSRTHPVAATAAAAARRALNQDSDRVVYREVVMGKLSGSENVSADSTPSSEIDSVFWSSVSSLGPAREQLGGVGNSVGGLGSTWENSVHGASGRALPQASAPGGGDPAQLALLGSDRERQLRSSGATTVQGLPAGSSPRGAAAAATEPVYMNSSSLVAIARREPGERIGLVQPLAPVTQASSEAKLSHLNKDVKDPHLAVALVTMPSTEPVARKRSNEAAIIGGGCAIVDSGMSTLTTAAVETELAGRVCTSSSSLSASVLPLPAALPDVITAPDPASSFARDHLTPSVRDPSLPSELPADPEPGSNGGSATAEPLVIDACVELSSPLLAVMHQKFGSSGGSIPSMADLTFYEQRSRSTSFASQASASSVSLSACSTSAASAEGVVEHDAPARPLFHLPAELPPAPVAAVAAVLRRRHAESAAVSASARHAAHGAELAAAVAAAAYHEPKAGSAAPEPDGIKAGIPAGRNSVSDGSESDYVCLPPTLTIGSTQSERTVFENGIRSAKPSVLTAVAARETGSGSMRVAACAVAAASSDLGDTRAGINSSTSASPPLPQLLPDVSAAGCESSARPSQASVLLRSNATVGGSRPDQSIQRSYTEVKAGAAGNSSGRPLSMHLLALDSNPSSPTLPRTGLHRQPTFTVPQSSSKSTSLSRQTERRTQSEVEFYTENYLNKHKKGLFGKTLPPEAMLSWTKESITKPMLRTDDKNVKKEALEVFRLIQCYMGDRKTKMAIAATALDVVARGWQAPFIRDEIYIQLCRQTTDNPKEESMLLGWELIAISLSFFPPSAQFCPLLEHHIYRHINEENSEGAQVTRLLQQVVPLVVPVSHYAQVCKRRLSRISAAGARKGLRKPTTEEVEQAKRSIINPSMFGETLEEIMTIQRERYPDRKLPWIQTTLSEEVLRLNGAQTEGIFRVPADIDEVNALKLRVDQWQAPAESSTDPHLPASLLKLWYRELYEPIIPNSMYESCMQHYSDSQQAINIVNALPEINRLVLSYLIRFLQVFAAPDNVAVTKMDVNNLAMVMAPNCLRCESDDPRIIFENTRKEMGFIRTLIRHMDTAYMQGVI